MATALTLQHSQLSTDCYQESGEILTSDPKVAQPSVLPDDIVFSAELCDFLARVLLRLAKEK